MSQIVESWSNVLTIQEAKDISLDILFDVADYCDKNNIRYYMICGTLLGAVRHKGFIPWDDDIDIAIPRPDYERFLNNYNGKYRILKPNSGLYYFGKVFDDSTIEIEPGIDYRKNKPTGISIDIFPIDGIVNDEKIIEKKLSKIKSLSTLLRLSNQSILYKKKITSIMIRCFARIIGSKNITHWIENVAKEYSYDEEDFVMRMRYTPMGKDKALAKDIYGNGIKIEFEKRLINAPSKYERWLESFFGKDYMSPPPVNERKSHHNKKYYKK